MLRKTMLACLLALQPAPSIPQTVNDSQLLEPVPLVVCGDAAGSAFHISPKLLLSVSHVTKLKGCMIDGQPEHIVYQSTKADFTILSDERPAHWLKVDCGGFVQGRKYLLVGHARGLDQLTVIPAVATGDYAHGYAVLIGIVTAQPGQSGGVVLDAETLRPVGTVNAANWEDGTSFSVELKGTSICGGHDA